MNINRVILTGNLTRDPELKQTQGGTAVCEFSLAVNSREKAPDGSWGDRADFFDVTVWGAEGEACAQYLAKGRPAAVDGRLRLERWEKDGQKHSRVRIVATSVQFLPTGKPGDGEPQTSFVGGTAPVAAQEPDFSAADDDIPFHHAERFDLDGHPGPRSCAYRAPSRLHLR